MKRKTERKSKEKFSQDDDEEEFYCDGNILDERSEDVDSSIKRKRRGGKASPQLKKSAEYEPDVQKKNKNEGGSGSCVDVIMKQAFEGYWDCNDNALVKQVLNSKGLPNIPEKLKNLDKRIWMTILVLCWLEIMCKSDQKVWQLIHRKGKEWVRKQGIDYDEIASGFGQNTILEVFGLV